MVDQLQIVVATSIARIDAVEWTRLANGRGLYQSHPWLSWAESNCGADAFYILARNRSGSLVGAMPAYVVPSGTDGSWNSWYDPLTVFAGDNAETDARRSAWFPLLLVGSLSGYDSDVLIDPSLNYADQATITHELMVRCQTVAKQRNVQSSAMMYAAEGAAIAVTNSWLGATQPILTSANSRIAASWRDLDAFLASFVRRRRYNIRREIDLFRASRSHVVESRLSDCLEALGPLLGNVHRKHGARDTDLDTTEYLRSQMAHLDDISRVFLEIVDEKSVGFSLCYEWGRELHVRVVGFDYERSARFAYFNLAYYLPLEYAIRRGFSQIHLGPGTYAAKATRGAVLDPTWSVIWPPDDDNRTWFEQVKHPGEDSREATRWLA